MRRPPDPLWLDGTLPADGVPHAAIVGTRRITPYGTRMAREFAAALARAGVAIVSGLAQGVDSVVHEAALEAGGVTIAVLGEGLLSFDRSGPYKRRQLARKIRERGALLSEYGLDFGAQSWTFPRRNATIAALANVVIVIEAPVGSGALITADRATELSRPLFAVPGPVGASTWEGSNRYIAEGKARMLLSPSDLSEPLGMPIEAPVVVEPSDQLDRAIDLLAATPLDADSLAGALEITAGDTATLFADLLLAGRIMPTGDGRFARR
jgi:DNA processing protein